MTPYLLDRVVSPKTSSIVNMVSETEAGSIRGSSIGSRDGGSVSSFNGKPKPAVYKRVSFGSSKGSMVETVIFDNDDIAPYKPVCHIASSLTSREEHVQVTPPSKVRVTFYESQKPQYVTTPDSSELSFNLYALSSMMASSEDVEKYISMNIGVDNPFRPEGELSREAESIVKNVQTGQPIAPSFPMEEYAIKQTAEEIEISNSVPILQNSPSTTFLDIQHGIVVPPASPSNVEQVMIKPKSKCHCCIVL